MHRGVFTNASRCIHKCIKVYLEAPTEKELGVSGVAESPAGQSIFSTDGRELQKPQHGINIIDGKKVYVK
ncbi:MAG: hypothetical protein K6F94_06535 [Bacteroidaceae bacterium]|nr:hypothetical protein [Bacteroidaceae bacterium]